jgi:phosphoglycolate phosphatase-like HAD superfamily hydrolase
MINIALYKNILWDFDGVLMDSMPVRDSGFKLVLSEYPEHQVETLMAFHRSNGGLSRYVKFRYFSNEILKESVTEEQIKRMAARFSDIMRQHLINASLLISDSIEFVKQNHHRYRMHVVSGSDQEELRFICNQLGISQYFHSIHGSPEVKDTLIKQILANHSYLHEETLMIGDSHNDQSAAITNAIDFCGYNNPRLKHQSAYYIESFKSRY